MNGSKTVDSGINDYNDLHFKADVKERSAAYKSLVNTYYDLSTVFYEWGWGDSFHFCYRFAGESFYNAIRRHEFALVAKLGLNRPGMQVLDVGCGIGGPLKAICRFTNQNITGITLNQYQVDRGNELCQRDAVCKDKAKLVQGDFMKMPFQEDSFDAAYAIEATCHAPDRVKVYSEVLRVLKPGSIFACYEWCMTDAYEKGNPEHERIKKMVEEGDALPDIVHTSVCLEALKKAGFEVLESRDMVNDEIGPNGKVWYLPLVPSWNPFTQRFQFNWLGFRLTSFLIRVLELAWIAPKGSYKTHRMLQHGGWGLAEAGKTGIMTPMFLMVGRVPDKTNGKTSRK